MAMPPPPPAVIPQVIPPPGSHLEQLLDMRDAARAAKKEAEDRLEAIDKGIEVEAAALAGPGHAIIDIAGSPHRKALRMRWHDGLWDVPVETLRTLYPAVWREAAKQGKGWWQLHPLGGSGS
jgi:hypothetical protein